VLSLITKSVSDRDVRTEVGAKDGHNRGFGHNVRRNVRRRSDLNFHNLLDLRTQLVGELDSDEVLRPYRTARLVSSGADVLAARRLQAEIYVANGFVSEQDVTTSGTLSTAVDSWSDDCTYFAVMRDGAAVATARQIRSADPDELPALALDGLYPEDLYRIRYLPAGSAVEISALARHRGAKSSDVVAIYARMWRESLERRHRAWVMAVDVKVFELLRKMICGNAIRPIGPQQDYMGSMVVPAVIWCDELNPEQRRRARLAADSTGFGSLLPRLFPQPTGGLR
jgi:N-acyl amino acid synthase FeeM